MTPQPAGAQKKSSAMTIIIIVVVVLVACCGISGILAAIAVPNFTKFQSRSKQSEGKVDVKQIFTAEKSVFAEKDVYSENPDELMLMIDGTRYVCVVSRTGAPLGKAPNGEELAAALRSRIMQLGVTGHCPKCDFTAACAGNIDNDAELDIWSISSAERQVGGRTITAGTPYNDFSDVTDSPGE